MIKQDISGNQVKLIYLGIGSNLGNRKKNIENALEKFHSSDGKKWFQKWDVVNLFENKLLVKAYI